MKVVSEELETQKVERNQHIAENNEIRDKIRLAIEQYKTKEASYQKAMEGYQTKVKDTEVVFKNEIESRVTTVLAKANNEKAKYERVNSNCQDLTANIKSIADKFNDLKETLEGGDKKMKGYQQEIETSKMEVQLLETEIGNLKSIDAKK